MQHRTLTIYDVIATLDREVKICLHRVFKTTFISTLIKQTSRTIVIIIKFCMYYQMNMLKDNELR